jgi:hypothetical protein
MKRSLYWFVWLQVGMPFIVAAAPFNFGRMLACAIGLILLGPFLALNSLVVGAILTLLDGKKEKALVLGLDCAAGFAFRFFNETEKPGVMAAITWFVAGALVSLLAIKWEPALQKSGQGVTE